MLHNALPYPLEEVAAGGGMGSLESLTAGAAKVTAGTAVEQDPET